MSKRRLGALLLLVSAATARGEAAWPGGIAFIDLGPAEGPPLQVEYDGRRALVLGRRCRGGKRDVAHLPLPAPSLCSLSFSRRENSTSSMRGMSG